VKKLQPTQSKLRHLLSLTIFAVLSISLAGRVCAQTVPYARTFAKSKGDVERALKEMQAYSGQKLPIVDGFVATGEKLLDRYERAFYQFSIDLVPDANDGTTIRLTAKITAWYADRDPAKSGYQVLPSNGRLELDFLDRLEERFNGKPATAGPNSISKPVIQAPRPKFNLSGLPNNSIPSAASPTPGSASAGIGSEEVAALRTKREAEDKRMQELSTELQNLEQIQRNQARPKNLVVVKKAGTPVVARAAEGSHLLFTASAQDEFEFLDAEGEWIHVQISGASRGFIRKSNLELPEFIAARLQKVGGSAGKEEPEVFRVEREETGTFPGDWQPLREKRVKIYTIRPVSQDARETGPGARLLYAASLFQKSSRELASATPPIDGVAIIFDAADGGIMGAVMENVKQLASGSLSIENFWKQSYLDPPDAFQPAPKP
jgi:hypothetical protein